MRHVHHPTQEVPDTEDTQGGGRRPGAAAGGQGYREGQGHRDMQTARK